MARFRGTVENTYRTNSTVASRLGHKALTVTANGWDAGVTVNLTGQKDRPDFVAIAATGGSKGNGASTSLYMGDLDKLREFIAMPRTLIATLTEWSRSYHDRGRDPIVGAGEDADAKLMVAMLAWEATR